MTLSASPFPASTDHGLGTQQKEFPWSINDLISKETELDCGPVLVEFTDENGNPLSDLFDDARRQSGNNEFGVKQTDDINDVGTYTIKYTVCYEDSAPDNCREGPPFTVDVVNPCSEPTLFRATTVEPDLEQDNYSGFSLRFEFDDFIIVPA